MDFDKLCTAFTFEEPFYGIILSSMDRKPVSPQEMDTICVARINGAFTLLYNPDFVGRLSNDTMMQVLKHEVMHYVFNHFTLWEDDPISRDEANIRNMAADMEVNSYIDRSKLNGLPGCFAEDYGYDKSLGTLAYYGKLKSLLQQQQQRQPGNGNGDGPEVEGDTGNAGNQGQAPANGNPSQQQGRSQNQKGGASQPNSGSQSGNGGGQPQQRIKQPQTFDDHRQWPTVDSQEMRDNLRANIETIICMAADEVEKSCGKIPGEMKARVELLRRKQKPVADWRRYVRRYIGDEFCDEIRKSKKRKSKRFPDSPGNRHKHKGRFLVAIDTSGSINMKEYNEFFAQIKTLNDYATFHVVECDTEINYEYDYKGKPNQDVHGHGGTDFQPVIDYYIERRRQYESLIYFTDGYSEIPRNTPKNTLWVVSSDGNKDRERYKVNGAKVVFITKKQ